MYPTPPPTISPKNDDFHNSSFALSGHKVPAQDSYFYSAPNSPAHKPYTQLWDTSNPTSSALPPPQQHAIRPPGISSPLISSNLPNKPPHVEQHKPQITSTYTKPTTTGHTSPPKPLYYSPTNPLPSPYSSSRPKPRPGFRKRILAKISSWIRALALWTKRNPMKAGLITFLPVLAAAGATSMFGDFGKMWVKGKEGLDKVVGKSRKSVKVGEKAKKEGKRIWGWGLDEFVGFNGSKGGPLDGMLKMLQMWVTHICRVTPSMVPRTMAIVLELYFLELEK